MRSFYTFKQHFWNVSSLQALSAETRLIALYVMTGPHTTQLGCFYCPKGYAAEDLNLSLNAVQEGFHDLTQQGWLCVALEDWLLLTHFFKLNPLQNNNQGCYVEKLFQRLPSLVQRAFRQELVTLLQTQAERLSPTFKKHLAHLSDSQRLDSTSASSRYTLTIHRKETRYDPHSQY